MPGSSGVRRCRAVVQKRTKEKPVKTGRHAKHIEYSIPLAKGNRTGAPRRVQSFITRLPLMFVRETDAGDVVQTLRSSA